MVTGAGLRSMQEVFDALGDQEIDKTSYLGFLADAYVKTGNLQEAGKTIDRALEQAATTGEQDFEPELLRIRGVVELNWKHDPWAAEGILQAGSCPGP